MRAFVTPGELLRIDAGIVHEGSGYTITKGKVSVGGKPRSDATITLSHAPFPNADLRRHMETMAKRIGFPFEAMVNG
jgi:3-hydroxyacyl-[acyl-carrier-protein] dehydratase